MKIHPVGAELFHVDRQTDRQTDMKKLMEGFCNFANVLHNELKKIAMCLLFDC
jgi:hypothetical protein